MQPFFSPNGAHDPRRFIRRPRKLRTRTRDRIRCFTQKVLASISPYMFISHTKMSIFFRKGRSWTYILEKQPGKLMLETFSWGNNWANHGTDKNKQSMTSCGNCCYYLERSNVSVKSKLQHPPPRAFDVFSCPGGGNLINLIFPGAGIWSLLIRGGEFDR